MKYGPEDIQYIKSHLGEWLAELSLGKPPAVYELELRERMVRVEEELKHQRELMRQGFELMEKRLEQLDKRIAMVEAPYSIASFTIAWLVSWLTWRMCRLFLPETFFSSCLADSLPLD